jgi:hypothetical protein
VPQRNANRIKRQGRGITKPLGHYKAAPAPKPLAAGLFGSERVLLANYILLSSFLLSSRPLSGSAFNIDRLARGGESMVPRFFVVLLLAGCTLSHAARAEPKLTAQAALPAPGADGFITLFNGHDLAGWEGLADYWSVKDGAISGHQTKAASKQTFLVLSVLTVKDFELHFRYRFASPEGNSGIQFRSTVLDSDTYRVGGYQADFDAERLYAGTIYDEAGVAGDRGTMSNRGERTTWDSESRRHVEHLGQGTADLLAFIKVGDWNDAILVARGNHITYSINGHIMTDLLDGSPAALQAGRLALQLHQGFTMDIRFKDLKIKLLD